MKEQQKRRRQRKPRGQGGDRIGVHQKEDCPWCSKNMRSNNLDRHIGQMHPEVASDDQLDLAKKLRAQKWVVCEGCNASMLSKNAARHRKVCNEAGRKGSSASRCGNWKVPRGPKPRATAPTTAAITTQA